MFWVWVSRGLRPWVWTGAPRGWRIGLRFGPSRACAPGYWLSPLRGLGIGFEVWGFPGACALGYGLSPLRGWNNVSEFLSRGLRPWLWTGAPPGLGDSHVASEFLNSIITVTPTLVAADGPAKPEIGPAWQDRSVRGRRCRFVASARLRVQPKWLCVIPGGNCGKALKELDGDGAGKVRTQGRDAAKKRGKSTRLSSWRLPFAELRKAILLFA